MPTFSKEPSPERDSANLSSLSVCTNHRGSNPSPVLAPSTKVLLSDRLAPHKWFLGDGLSVSSEGLSVSFVEALLALLDHLLASVKSSVPLLGAGFASLESSKSMEADAEARGLVGKSPVDAPVMDHIIQKHVILEIRG